MTYGTYGRCIHLKFVAGRSKSSWFTKMLGAHNLNFAAKRMDLHRSVAWDRRDLQMKQGWIGHHTYRWTWHRWNL